MVLVIVGDFDVTGVRRLPHKADAPLIVDTDAVLAGPVALESFQPVAWRGEQVLPMVGLIQIDKLAAGRFLDIRRQLSGPLATVDFLGFPIGEALDHPPIITSDDTIAKKYYLGLQGC